MCAIHIYNQLERQLYLITFEGPIHTALLVHVCICTDVTPVTMQRETRAALMHHANPKRPHNASY